jgi:hypothetical protein
MAVQIYRTGLSNLIPGSHLTDMINRQFADSPPTVHARRTGGYVDNQKFEYVKNFGLAHQV